MIVSVAPKQDTHEELTRLRKKYKALKIGLTTSNARKNAIKMYI